LDFAVDHLDVAAAVACNLDQELGAKINDLALRGQQREAPGTFRYIGHGTTIT
jgi:hypothetical protein